MDQQRDRWLKLLPMAGLLFVMNTALAQVSKGSNPTLPDSPGFLVAQTSNLGQTSNQPGFASATEQQPPQPQTSSSQTREPVGTAAAEAPVVTGVAASAPAGAAIAPAKQKRVRVFLISMAAVAGAGIALGTVAALSAGSPSKPPGAH